MCRCAYHHSIQLPAENNRPVLVANPTAGGRHRQYRLPGAVEVFKKEPLTYKARCPSEMPRCSRGSGSYRQHLVVSTQGTLEVIFQHDAPGEVDRSADTGSSHAAIRSQNTVINGNRTANIYAQAGEAVYRTEVRKQLPEQRLCFAGKRWY